MAAREHGACTISLSDDEVADDTGAVGSSSQEQVASRHCENGVAFGLADLARRREGLENS